MGDTDAGDHARVAFLRVALLAATIATFALLYVPQAVLPQLSDEFSVSPGASTLVISTATAGLAVAGIPLAMLSEVVGRRTVMIAALCVATATGLLLAVVPSFTVLLVLRAIQGIALAGVPAVAMAHVADELQGAALGASMGIYVAGTTIGGMSGRIVGGVLSDAAGWRVGIAAVGVLAAVATVIFAVLLPRPRARAAASGQVRAVIVGLRRAVSDPVLYGPYLIAAFGMGSFVAVYNVLPFRLVGPPFDIPAGLASLAFLAYLAGSVTSGIAGRLADRYGRPAVLWVSLALALVGLALSLPDVLTTVLVGLVVFTGGFFGAHSVASGWVGARAPAMARGPASALYLFAYYVGSSVGGGIGGVTYGSYGWPTLVSLLACWLAVAAAAVLGGWWLSRRHPLPR